MKKLICTKLLTFMCLNLLITPLIHGGKKFQRGKNSGYAKQYNKFHSRKNFTQKLNKQEKRRKSRNHIFSESLSQTNKERNALLKEILHTKEATRKKNILYNKKKYIKQTINIDPELNSLSLSIRGINLSPWLIPFIIFGFFAQTAEAKEYSGNYIGLVEITQDSFFPIFKEIMEPAYSEFSNLLNGYTGYHEEARANLSFENQILYCDETGNEKYYRYSVKVEPGNYITTKRPCACEIMTKILTCKEYSFESDYNSFPFLEFTTSSTPSALEITSQIAQIITPVGIFLGCAAIPTALCCLLNKKCRKKIIKCTKKLSKKSTVTIEDITDEPDPLVSTEIHNETDTKSSATASNTENDYNTSSSETNSETDDSTSIEEDSSTETEY